MSRLVSTVRCRRKAISAGQYSTKLPGLNVEGQVVGAMASTETKAGPGSGAGVRNSAVPRWFIPTLTVVCGLLLVAIVIGRVFNIAPGVKPTDFLDFPLVAAVTAGGWTRGAPPTAQPDRLAVLSDWIEQRTRSPGCHVQGLPFDGLAVCLVTRGGLRPVAADAARLPRRPPPVASLAAGGMDCSGLPENVFERARRASGKWGAGVTNVTACHISRRVRRRVRRNETASLAPSRRSATRAI